MAEASEIIRTERVEVIDQEGRVRVVIGMLGQGDSPIFGLVVQDETGRDRAWVQHDGPGAEVGLDHGGDTAIALTVSESGEPSLLLAD